MTEKLRHKLIEIIQSEVEGVFFKSDEDYDAPFEDMGIDSLDIMTILLKLQETYGIEISDEDTETLTTFNELASYLIEKSSQNASS